MQRPFKGEYEQAIAYSILNVEPEPVTALRSGIPMELERIVNKCLQKEASARYQHADELAVDLSTIKKQIEAGESKKQPAESKPSGRKPLLRYGSLAAFLALVVFFGYYFWPEQQSRINSIAVLPLNNLSRDSGQDYLDSLQANWQQGEKASIARDLADIHNGLGQKEEALTWLERVYELRNYINLNDIKVDPMFDSLRDEPRFKALLKKVNFEVGD